MLSAAADNSEPSSVNFLSVQIHAAQLSIGLLQRIFGQRCSGSKGLVALGLQKGDRIGIYSPNCAEWTLIQLAAARADLILVNVNPAF